MSTPLLVFEAVFVKGLGNMSDESKDKSVKPAAGTPNAELPLVNAGKVAVTYTAVPAKGPSDKQIHRRRKLPDVPSKSSRQEGGK